MSSKLPPTPVGVPPGHSYWNDWYERLRNLVNNTLLNHNDLQNIQGGSASERYHLTSGQQTDLTDGGDSTLHFHASDRARANHTGTQDHNTTLSGLQGGTAGQYYHLTSAEYTGTGTGNFVRETSPTLVTPKATTTIGVGNTTPSASGSGISFPATQSASTDANTLDDYEEGTFTPTIEGTTTAGSGTYSVQVGHYTKIGNSVAFTAILVWSAHTGTGNMNISGLPFTSANVSNLEHPVASISSNLALTAGNYLQTYIPQNSTQVLLRQVPTGGGALVAIPLDTAATLEVSGHYKV